MKKAFTLAEVLIVLGIIGIVSAMTIPTLITKIRQKTLETAFKKTYSNLQTAFKLVINEGYSVYELNPTEERPDGDPNFSTAFGRQLRLKYRAQSLIQPYSSKLKYQQSIRNYTKTKLSTVPQCSQFLNSGDAFTAADGSIISIAQNCGALWITVDTNGISGPNALGHDIFLFFALKDTDELLPATKESEIAIDDDGKPYYNNTSENKNKCSHSAKSSINGTTCTQFAIKNKCPDDDSKSYWDCLP